ncbi:hypothetical protein MTO96_049624 [Rhipicephalus appendiculatus]
MDCLGKLVDNVSAAEFRSLWEEYEAQRSGRLQEFFDSTNGRFQHPVVKKWAEELYKLRATHLSQKAK